MLCDRSKNLLLSIVIVLVIVLVACVIWYHGTGWQTTSCKQYENILINAPKGISTLRFRNAIFTVASSTGTVLYSGNVSGVLNDMVKAFAPANNPQLGITQPVNFQLPTPLNPFSFQFPGKNDKNSVLDSNGNFKSIGGFSICDSNSSPPCSADSDCSNYTVNGVTYNLGKCAAKRFSDGTCGNNNFSSGANATTADTSQVCQSGNWVPASSIPGNCELCPNNLSVTLTLEYRIIF